MINILPIATKEWLCPDGYDCVAHDDIPSVFNECIIVNSLADKWDGSHLDVKSPLRQLKMDRVLLFRRKDRPYTAT